MDKELTDIVALDRRHVWHPFTQELTAPDPIEIVTGKGAVLTAADGREYLDLISSWWVNIHGHAHPVIADAIAEQAQKLEQVIFAGYTHRPAVELVSRLIEKLPNGLERAFFSDDGSTAVEVALKLATQYWLNQGKPRKRFLTFEGGYHGDTVGAMSAGRASGFFTAFESLMFQVDPLPFPETWEDDDEVEVKEKNALAALENYLEQHGNDTAALIIEPLIQGAAGMRMCRPQFLQALSECLQQHGVLLIFDEIMTGFGRTGEMFASIKAGVVPDIICLSKGLSGGFLPISLTICREHIYQAFLDEGFDKAFSHGHSFTANPLACAAGIASLALFDSENTMERVKRIEALHNERIDNLKKSSSVHHHRMMGDIAAFDIRVSDAGYTSSIGARLRGYFHERGLLLRPLGNVVYLMPPYCIDESQLHHTYDVIEGALIDLGNL